MVLVHGRALALDEDGWDRAHELGLAPANELHHSKPHRFPDGDGEAVDAGTEGVPEGAKAAMRVLDVLEEQRGGVDLLMGHIGDGAHLLVAADLFGDPTQLADPLDGVDPGPQVSGSSRCTVDRRARERHRGNRYLPPSPPPRDPRHVKGHGTAPLTSGPEAFYMK